MISTRQSRARQIKWEEQKGRFRAIFPKLTDEDFNYDENNKYVMLRKLEFKLNMTVAEMLVLLEKQ